MSFCFLFVKTSSRRIIPFLLILLLSGCSHLQETAKAVWGSSMTHLERAKADGRTVVIHEERGRAFQDIIKLLEDKKVNVYLKDKNENYLAAMGFEGHVDTTQVGLFFTPQPQGKDTKIEIASLSPSLVRDVEVLLLANFKQGAGNEKT